MASPDISRRRQTPLSRRQQSTDRNLLLQHLSLHRCQGLLRVEKQVITVIIGRFWAVLIATSSRQQIWDSMSTQEKQTYLKTTTDQGNKR